MKYFYLIDFYFTRQFLRYFFLYFILFIVVYCFSIIITELPTLLEQTSYNQFITPSHIIGYYLLSTPKYINATISFSFLFALNYTLSRLYQYNEILTVVTGGLSLKRVTLNFKLLALFVSFILLVCNNTVFPLIMKESKLYAEKLSLAQGDQEFAGMIIIRDEQGNYYLGDYFDKSKNRLLNFIILHKNQDPQYKNENSLPYSLSEFQNLFHLNIEEQKKKISNTETNTKLPIYFDSYTKGSFLEWDKGQWIMHKGFIFNLKKSTGNLYTKIESKRLMLNIQPKMFYYTHYSIEEMNFFQGLGYIQFLKLHYKPTNDTVVQLYDEKIISCFNVFILALFGTQIGKVFARKNPFIMSLISTFIIAFFFLVLVKTSYSLTKVSILPLPLGLLLGYIISLLIYFIWFQRRAI